MDQPWLLANASWVISKPKNHKTSGSISPSFSPTCCTPDRHNAVQRRAIAKTMPSSNSCLPWAGRAQGQPVARRPAWRCLVAPRDGSWGVTPALPHPVMMVEELPGEPQLGDLQLADPTRSKLERRVLLCNGLAIIWHLPAN